MFLITVSILILLCPPSHLSIYSKLPRLFCVVMSPPCNDLVDASHSFYLLFFFLSFCSDIQFVTLSIFRPWTIKEFYFSLCICPLIDIPNLSGGKNHCFDLSIYSAWMSREQNNMSQSTTFQEIMILVTQHFSLFILRWLITVVYFFPRVIHLLFS